MRSLTVAILALWGSLSLSATTVVTEPFPPAQMTSLYIESDTATSATTIQTQGDTIVYKVTKGDTVLDSATVHPTGEDWFKFIQAINAAKVYNWAPTYYYPGQGPSWVIELVMEDRKFSSQGTNEFPLNGNESQPQANPLSGPSVPFQIFWQAVLKLAGKGPPPVKQ